MGWDLKAFVWQKDQLVTQLHWQENGPTFSNTPYRYQACRWEDPEGWLKDAQPRCGGGVGKDSGGAGEDCDLGRCDLRPDHGTGGYRLLRRAGQAPGAERLLAGSQVWAGSRPACWAATLHSADPAQASTPAPTLLPHGLGWLHLPASSDQTLWP